jgi:hypothetical protein
MPEFIGEGLEDLADRIAQLSERQAANARILLEEIQRHRSEAREQGRNFSAPTGAQLLDQLLGARSPLITSLSWSLSTPSPGTIDLTVGAFNPDPVTRSSLFVHVLVGPVGLVADVGQALAVADARFQSLTEPPFPGLSLNPSATAWLNFAVEVPTGIEPSNYLGNIFLFRSDFFVASQVFSRALFVFQVT